MVRRIKVIILTIIFTITSFTTYAAPATTTNYSKTFQQIYESKDVYKDTQKRLSELHKKHSSITYLFSAGKLTTSIKSKLLKSSTTINKLNYISIDIVSKLLKLSYI